MFQRPAIDRASHGQEEDKERTGSLRLKQRHVAASLIHPDAAGGSLEDQNAVYIILTIVFGAIVIGGFCLIAYAFTTRQRLRELAMRERIALIERGLVPPPEVDPVRFERIVGASTRPRSATAQRYRSAGMMLMGLGVALLILLAFAAGVPGVGIGVGGGLVALGAAIFFNGVLMAQSEPHELSDYSAHKGRTEPPPTLGT